jgi:hypothetical protein
MAVLKSTSQMSELSADKQTCESAKKVLFETIVTDQIKEPNPRPTVSLESIWRTIMKSGMTKLAAAAVIVAAVMVGLHYYAGPIGVTSVAWAELVQRVEQSHNEYYKELLLAMEAKDVQKVSARADALSEFWQGMNMLAEEGLESTEDSLNMLNHESFRNRFQEFEEQIFIVYAEQFIAWMNKIEDPAWINEIIHMCRQMEEYAEEIREPGRHTELDFSYAEHCLLSFVTYCQWFEQLPWDNPGQHMTPAMLLTRIQRDLNIARREIEALEVRGVIPFLKRCMQQAQKNVLDLDIKTASSRTKGQRELCRHLTRRIDELCALITYAEIARQDFIEQLMRQNHQFDRGERFDQVLTEEFGNKGPFADYYIERIDQSLDLCEQLLAELESMQ